MQKKKGANCCGSPKFALQRHEGADWDGNSCWKNSISAGQSTHALHSQYVHAYYQGIVKMFSCLLLITINIFCTFSLKQHPKKLKTAKSQSLPYGNRSKQLAFSQGSDWTLSSGSAEHLGMLLPYRSYYAGLNLPGMIQIYKTQNHLISRQPYQHVLSCF